MKHAPTSTIATARPPGDAAPACRLHVSAGSARRLPPIDAVARARDGLCHHMPPATYHARRCPLRTFPQPARRATSGFTLVELVAAVAITALITASTATVLHTIQSTQRRLDTQMQRQAEARAGIGAIATALRNAWRPSAEDGAFLEGLDDVLGGAPADRIAFFTIRHRPVRPGEPESDVHEVAFHLEPPAGPEVDGPMLMMRIDPTRNAPPDGGGVMHPVARHVVGLDIAYHDGIDWRDAWPADRRGWPTAVRIELLVATGGAEHQRWSTRRLVNFPHLAAAPREPSP